MGRGAARVYSPLYGQHPHRQPALRPGHSIGTDEQGSRVETFTLEGRLHRVDGPAVVKITSIGVRIEEYWLHGVPRHGDQPSSIVTLEDGLVRIEEWRTLDDAGKPQLHRELEPAQIITEAEGTIVKEYWLNGELGRAATDPDAEGPTRIETWPDGTVISKHDLGDEVLHREEGPAYIMQRPDGSRVEEYWNDGILVDTVKR